MFTLLIAAISGSLAATYEIAALGGKNDGVFDNTKIIQGAINECSQSGGGVVLLSGGGQYLSRTLYIKSDVTLHIDSGTTLLASPDITTYPDDTHKIMYKREAHMNRCFIYGEGVRNFAFTGTGTIDGNGHKANFPKGRPMLLRFKDCERITMRDLTLQNPAAWTSAWLYCNDIMVSGVRIISRVNNNGDGLDFDGCQDVRVSDSYFDNSDDCICLQTSRADRPCRRITVTNCIFKTQWAGMRIGLLSMGEISQVTVSNCTFNDIKDAGLKIQQNEAGSLSDMLFTNLVMNNVPRPIFMTLCQQRACVDEPIDTLDEPKFLGRMKFSNIVVNNEALDTKSCFVLSGTPGRYIEDITIRDVHFRISGGGTAEDAQRQDIPEFDLTSMRHHWPEFRCLGGVLPSSALFARYVKGLTVSDFVVDIVGDDVRPSTYLKDVEGDVVVTDK